MKELCTDKRMALVFVPASRPFNVTSILKKWDRNMKSGFINELVKRKFRYVDNFFILYDSGEPFLESALRGGC